MVGKPLVLIAFDAADRRLARSLAADGRLPTLAGMLDRGAVIDVETPYAVLVGGTWRDFATATTVSRHGHYCFDQLVPGTYEIRRTDPHTSEPPFWDALVAHGREVTVVDVPFTDIRAGSAAVQVVDWGRHDNNVGFRAHPPELTAHIEERYGRLPEDACDLYGTAGRHVELRDDLLHSIACKTELLCELLDRRPDVLLGVFHETHCAGHQFWSIHDETHPAHDPDLATRLGDPLVDVLEAHDAALNRIVEAAGPNASVLALYSHGMGPHYDACFLLNWMLRRMDGIPDRPSRLDVARTKLCQALDGRRIAAEAKAGRVDRYRGRVDRRQRYFVIPNQDTYGAIRVNLVGREPDGLVQPGADLEETLRFLEDRLPTWVNVETGEPVVERVVRRRDVYEDSDVCALPDLFVEWNRSRGIRSIEAPEFGRIERTYTGTRTGDHYAGGLLVGVGPGIRAGTHAPIHTRDLGPTVTEAFGVTLPRVDGRAHPTLFAD